jgi:ABC-type thiamin/hydroxymethylpyrimidine transport system permease subunit
MNAYFLYRLSSRLCRLSLCSTVAAVSICFDFISLYYANLSPEWTISLGTLLGINLHVISKETLLDELLKESFDRVTTLRN